jgi:hypothetical protein
MSRVTSCLSLLCVASLVLAFATSCQMAAGPPPSLPTYAGTLDIVMVDRGMDLEHGMQFEMELHLDTPTQLFLIEFTDSTRLVAMEEQGKSPAMQIPVPAKLGHLYLMPGGRYRARGDILDTLRLEAGRPVSHLRLNWLEFVSAPSDTAKSGAKLGY